MLPCRNFSALRILLLSLPSLMRRSSMTAVLFRCRLSEWTPLFSNTAIILPAMQSKSTMVYLTTQNCPLLYSSKLYVLDSCCPAVEAAFRQCTQKPVHVWCIQGCEKTQDGAVYERLIEDICAENEDIEKVKLHKYIKIISCVLVKAGV